MEVASWLKLQSAYEIARPDARLSRGRRFPLKRLTPYLLVLPAMAVVMGLVLYPLVFSVFSSFHVDDLLDPGVHTFIGLQNFGQVLSSSAFQVAARNTLIYFVLATAGVLLVGLTISSWLHSINHKWRGLFLIIVVLPWAVPGVVTGLVWSFIYNPTFGILDGVLRSLHVITTNIIWFRNTDVSLVLIAVTLIWQTVPLASIILLAGLESIPPTLYEAASCDGCTGTRLLFRITLPLLRPALAIVLVQSAVLSISIFDQVYVLTGYAKSTSSVVIQTYLDAFQNLNFGQGISAALLITLAITLVGYLYLRFIYREVSY